MLSPHLFLQLHRRGNQQHREQREQREQPEQPCGDGAGAGAWLALREGLTRAIKTLKQPAVVGAMRAALGLAVLLPVLLGGAAQGRPRVRTFSIPIAGRPRTVRLRQQ